MTTTMMMATWLERAWSTMEQATQYFLLFYMFGGWGLGARGVAPPPPLAAITVSCERLFLCAATPCLARGATDEEWPLSEINISRRCRPKWTHQTFLGGARCRRVSITQVINAGMINGFRNRHLPLDYSDNYLKSLLELYSLITIFVSWFKAVNSFPLHLTFSFSEFFLLCLVFSQLKRIIL